MLANVTSWKPSIGPIAAAVMFDAMDATAIHANNPALPRNFLVINTILKHNINNPKRFF